VIYVSAALRRNLWIDRDRLGVEGVSYGGQLSAWLVTQTNIFKASIPTAAIINLVSYNYMTYYNQYEQMEFGIFPHQGNLMDLMWQRSSLKYVAQVHTPVMLMHGENDADVPIAEAEQFYIGLKDAGVETVLCATRAKATACASRNTLWTASTAPSSGTKSIPVGK
jgi:dipeptidyl aminopeptidase/acylaminoacyl peptidase